MTADAEDACSDGSELLCWICYDGAGPAGELLKPCSCPSRVAHRRCIARWQLQQAGREEERHCRFCKQCLPDWREAFDEQAAAAPRTEPTMSIQFNGQTYWLHVRVGEGGVERFKEDVRRLLGLTEEQAFDITFECRVPGQDDNSRMELRGLDAYDAAVYCASLSAAERVRSRGERRSKRRSTASARSGGGAAAGDDVARVRDQEQQPGRDRQQQQQGQDQRPQQQPRQLVPGHGSAGAVAPPTTATTSNSNSSSGPSSSDGGSSSPRSVRSGGSGGASGNTSFADLSDAGALEQQQPLPQQQLRGSLSSGGSLADKLRDAVRGLFVRRSGSGSVSGSHAQA